MIIPYYNWSSIRLCWGEQSQQGKWSELRKQNLHYILIGIILASGKLTNRHRHRKSIIFLGVNTINMINIRWIWKCPAGYVSWSRSVTDCICLLWWLVIIPIHNQGFFALLRSTLVTTDERLLTTTSTSTSTTTTNNNNNHHHNQFHSFDHKRRKKRAFLSSCFIFWRRSTSPSAEAEMANLVWLDLEIPTWKT